MTIFIRLMADQEKAANLMDSCTAVRLGQKNARVFNMEPESFLTVPGAPFAYWASDLVLHVFARVEALECEQRYARIGSSTGDDFRFVRAYWEVVDRSKWIGFAKGGAYSPYYGDVYLVANWDNDGVQIRNFHDPKTGKLRSRPQNIEYFGRPGITWSRRTQGGLSLRALPAGCMFADKGPVIFFDSDNTDDLSTLLAIVNSETFELLVSLQMAFGSYEVGVIQKTPIPQCDETQQSKLSALARRSWRLKRELDTVEETSHAFILPAILRARLDDYDPISIKKELKQIQSEIDSIVFDLFGFDESDQISIKDHESASIGGDSDQSDNDLVIGNNENLTGDISGLLSWTVGVTFGRFDLRLGTGDRKAPQEPEPFEPLPLQSPGMLPPEIEPFHPHAGILVDDEGHPHDLPRLLEDVLRRVDTAIQVDIRQWLRREFFPLHLQRYSKSRRKAPVYLPLSTLSGSYTLWLYYPYLTKETLFTAVNDFVEPKIQQVREDLDFLRSKGNSRSKNDEKELEVGTDLLTELADFRDTLLAVAPKYLPNHDDGIQIVMSPLWQLFRHKTWQKDLKDTWENLERGDFDWSRLAMWYFPERVLRKCQEDRNLAIAQGVEDKLWEAVEKPVMRGSKASVETKLEWQSKRLTDDELNVLIEGCIKEKTA